MRSRPYYLAHEPYVTGSPLVAADKLSKRQWVDAFIDLYIQTVGGGNLTDKVIREAVGDAKKRAKLIESQFRS